MKTAIAMTALVGQALAVSPVQKVVQLLGELKTQVQGELDTEAKSMEEYSSYCNDESKERGFQIKTAKADIERFEATIEDSNGKISALDTTIAESGSSVANKQGELAEATKIRENDNGDFQAAQKELVDTVDTLSRAAAVLKRELSFAQGASSSQLKSKLGNMLNALGMIVEASGSESSKKVSAFLQDDDLSLVQQPQASTSNYDSKSGGIVDAIKDMQNEAEDNLASVRKNETKARHAFELLKQGLQDEVANLEKVIAESTSTKGATAEAKAKAEEDLARTKKALSADESFLSKLQSECQVKATEWEARQKSAAEEMAALEKAKEILTSGVNGGTVSFVQVKASTKNEEVRSQLVNSLRKLSRKVHSFGLMQIASHAASDPFVKIRGMVNDMISKLEKQAAEEATQEAFCQEENAKSKKTKEAKSASVDKYTVRLEKANAGVAELSQEINELTAEVSEIEKSNAEATKIRGDENAEYKTASKEQKEAVEAVAKAIQVLQDYYGNSDSFLQQPAFGGAKSDSGNNIVSFLEVAQSDFTTLLTETETNESQAVEAYETLMQENKISKASKEASIKGKTSEVQAVKVAIEDATSDLKTSQKELDAVLEYIEKLRPQCESKAMTYAERKAAREAEMEGLNTALDILSGEEAAVSFMQKRASAGQTFLGFAL